MSATSFRLERVGELGDDLVLKVEHIGDRLLERVTPDLAASFRIRQLRDHADALLVALDRALENVTDAELLADLRVVYSPSFCRLKPCFGEMIKRPPMRDRSLVRFWVIPSAK